MCCIEESSSEHFQTTLHRAPQSWFSCVVCEWQRREKEKGKDEKSELPGVNKVGKTYSFRWLSHSDFSFLVPLYTLHVLLQYIPSLCDSSWPRQGERQGQGHTASYARVGHSITQGHVMQCKGANWLHLWIYIHNCTSLSHHTCFIVLKVGKSKAWMPGYAEQLKLTQFRLWEMSGWFFAVSANEHFHLLCFLLRQETTNFPC